MHAVDTLTATQMARWLRETALNTRAKRTSPHLSEAEMNLAPHVAFRLEQAADLLEGKRWPGEPPHCPTCACGMTCDFCPGAEPEEVARCFAMNGHGHCSAVRKQGSEARDPPPYNCTVYKQNARCARYPDCPCGHAEEFCA